MTLRPAPYAADVRAKGWRFELDHERIRQSDTWALTPPEMRPWLLMLWMTAWEQTPCGSLPATDELIAARIGMPMKTFAKHRACLMRGWWPAEDGRLYHDTIVLRTLEMLEYRRKEAERRNRNRGKTPSVPALSRGTDAGHTQDSTGAPDTGTGTGTLSSLRSESASAPEIVEKASEALKAAGLIDVDESLPRLAELLEAGITIPELAAAAKVAVGKGKTSAYALATAEGRRRDAAVQPLPAAAVADPDSRSAVEAEGLAKGIGPWNEIDEQWPTYKARVRGAPTPKTFDLKALAAMAPIRSGAH